MTILLILTTLCYLIIPALVIKLCKKVSLFNKIGDILTLYILGIIIANTLIFPFEEFAAKVYKIQDILTSITIPLAMPLILFSCNFKKLPIKSALLSLIFGVVAMSISIITGFYIFGPLSGIEDFDKIAGLLVGVYTGGTPNLAAIKMMLDIDEQTYILVNSFDMIVCFFYLVFLMSIGIKLFRRFLPKKNLTISANKIEDNVDQEDETYTKIFTKENFLASIASVGLSILIAGLSIGISFLISGKINMIILILSLTTLAIIASFIPKVKKAKKSYDIGMYLVLIFSLVIASMVDIANINFQEGLWFFAYIAFAIFGSLFIQAIFAKIFKIDADTTIITSVGLINSPLFVPMIADNMKNKEVILIGITVGIIGYAIGNYLGVIMATIL